MMRCMRRASAALWIFYNRSAELKPCTRLTSLLSLTQESLRIIALALTTTTCEWCVCTLQVKVFILMDAGDQRLSLEGNFKLKKKVSTPSRWKVMERNSHLCAVNYFKTNNLLRALRQKSINALLHNTSYGYAPSDLICGLRMVRVSAQEEEISPRLIDSIY
jgi:hypothetical protein